MKLRLSPLKNQMLKLAWPMVMSQLGIMLQGVTDTIMVGPLGDNYLASANMANNVFFLYTSLFMGMLFSVSTVISIKDGAGDKNSTGLTFKVGIWLSVFLGLISIGVTEVCIYNFNWLGQIEEINKIAPLFLRIIGFSALPMLIFIAARQFSDGLGFTSVSMYISIGGLLLNIVLNGVGIYGWLTGIPLGIEGAALATLISRILMAVGLLIYIYKHPSLSLIAKKQKITLFLFKIEIKKLIQLGLPLGIQFFAEVAAFAVGGLIVGTISSVQAAAHTVALTISALTYMTVSGVAQAVGILSGNFFGEKNKTKLLQLGKESIQLGTVFQIVAAIFLLVFRGYISKAFNLKGDTYELACYLFLIAALFQIADGIQVIAMNLLRGIEDVNSSMAIALVSYWVIPIPVGWYFGKVLGYGAEAVWWGFVAGLILSSLLGSARYFYKVKKLIF